MKYSVFAALALLAACSRTASNPYDVYSLQDSAATTIRESEPSLPAGFVSIMEQQADGKWVVRNEDALVP
jgi:hypothetical protein